MNVVLAVTISIATHLRHEDSSTCYLLQRTSRVVNEGVYIYTVGRALMLPPRGLDAAKRRLGPAAAASTRFSALIRVYNMFERLKRRGT